MKTISRILLVMVAIFSTGLMAWAVTGRGPAEASDVKAGGATESATGFDPSAAALGVRSASDLEKLQAAQLRLANEQAGLTELQRAAPQQMNNAQIIRDWYNAEDDLYDRIAARPDAPAARSAWLACMADRGSTVDSREDAERYVTSGDVPADERDKMIASRDACDRALQPWLDKDARDEYTQWFDDHEAEINAYRRLLGI